MTRERALWIERKVFYEELNNLAGEFDDAEVAFQVGQCIGRMQECLHWELEKEIEEDDADD